MLRFAVISFEIFWYFASVVQGELDIISLLSEVHSSQAFENVIFMKNQNARLNQSFVYEKSRQRWTIDQDELKDFTSELIARLMQDVQRPVLQTDELTSFFFKQHFSESSITVCLLDGKLSDNSGLLKNLISNLRHMTLSRILFLFSCKGGRLETLKTVFRFCWSNKIINVIGVFADYQETDVFYSYTHFPVFKLEIKAFSENPKTEDYYYPNRLNDLKRFKLPIILGGSDPRIIVYRRPNGERVIAGFAGHFLKAFEYKYNCELFEPLASKSNSFAPAQELIAAVRNGTVEISAGLTFPSIPPIGYTYPYEQMNWCVMMPVEPDIPDYEFYVIVFELSAFLITLVTLVMMSMLLSGALYHHGYKADFLNMILHETCLRGALGQSFSEIVKPPAIVRFIYLQICVLGILLTTSYNAYFATYVTSAPKEPALKNFDEILHSTIKVYAWTPEFNELVGRVSEFKRYVPMFYLENSYQQYLKMRDSFNTKFGYITPTTKWKIVHEQQKIFTTPLFRRNDDLCFFNNIPMCFPVNENSIFKDKLNQLMLETAQSGLTSHWQKIGFIEMIMAGKLSFADLSSKRSFEAMELADLYYIWMGFGLIILISFLVFFIELTVFYKVKIRKQIFHFRKRLING